MKENLDALKALKGGFQGGKLNEAEKNKMVQLAIYILSYTTRITKKIITNKNQLPLDIWVKLDEFEKLIKKLWSEEAEQEAVKTTERLKNRAKTDLPGAIIEAEQILNSII